MFIAVILEVFAAFVDAAFAFDAGFIVIAFEEFVFVIALANEGMRSSLACGQRRGFVAFDAFAVETYGFALRANREFLNESAVAPERGFPIIFAACAVSGGIAFRFYAFSVEAERFVIRAVCFGDNRIFAGYQRAGGVTNSHE